MRLQAELIDFVEKKPDPEFILVTLIATEGSTYRKAGAMKVVAFDGQAAGLISGGCLEGMIVEHALKFAQGDAADELMLDTRDEYDRLFGSNLGCQGKLTLKFAKLDKRTLLTETYLGISKTEELNLLIFGAGADIDPLQELLVWTRWRVQYYSHQSDLVAQRQQQGWPIEHLPSIPADFQISNPPRSAAILMSHHYPYDLEVLAKLIPFELPYIGMLGPEKRKRQLIQDLAKIYKINLTAEQQKNLHGPIGIPGLGEGECAIALAIVAELQALFYGQSRQQ